MKLLSIETSCDDTGISIFEVKGGTTNATFKVLAHTSNSQINIHAPFGGVYPMLAKREHIKNLPILLEVALKQAKLIDEEKPVDLIAVTSGPGLEPTLWTGITFAQELSKKWQVPVIPVNHMEGHVLSPFGKSKGKFAISKVKTPLLSLLVSGGHTELVLSQKWLEYEIVGETMDDAVGEAFDKVARILGLPYPGGPEISKLAEELRQKEEQDFEGRRSATGARIEKFSSKKILDPKNSAFPYSLPRPMLHSKNLDFSFSGLKTAVLYLTQKLGSLTPKVKSQIALEFENAAIETLVAKTAKALEQYKVKTLVVAGGVGANQHLRNEMQKLAKRAKVKLFFPTPALSTDNSIMIGIAGYLRFIKNKRKTPKPASIKAAGNMRF